MPARKEKNRRGGGGLKMRAATGDPVATQERQRSTFQRRRSGGNVGESTLASQGINKIDLDDYIGVQDTRQRSQGSSSKMVKKQALPTIPRTVC